MTNSDRNHALMEGERIGSMDAYFSARPSTHEKLFGDGFARGWGAQSARIVDLERQLKAALKDAGQEKVDWSKQIPEKTIQKAAVLLEDKFKDCGIFSATVEQWSNKLRSWRFYAAEFSRVLIEASKAEEKQS